MNNVSIIGNLARDNELKYTKSGRAVLSNTIVINEGYGDKKKAYFIPFVAWEKQAENAANYTNKGSKVAINGKLTSRQFEDRQGNNRTVVEVVANPYQGIEFLDNRNNKNQGSTMNANQGNTRNDSSPYGESSVEVTDEMLPF